MSVINYDKILGLVYTEKSNKQVADGKYQLKVDKKSNKKEISSLVKNTFGVDVEKINVLNTKSKTKRFKGVEGTRSSYKKAIITLKKGQSINFS